MNILGASLLSLQDTAEAASVLERAVAESAPLKRGHPQRLRAQLLGIWAAIFHGKAIESGPAIERLLTDMTGGGHPLPEDYAGALRTKAVAAAARGDGPVALDFSMRALRTAEERLGPYHNQSVLALVELSRAHAVSGNTALAVTTGERAVARALEAYARRQTHPNVMRARSALAQAHGQAGQTDLAIVELDALVRDGLALFGSSSRSVAEDLVAMTRLKLNAGRIDEALEDIDRALPILRDQYDTRSSGYLAVVNLRQQIVNTLP